MINVQPSHFAPTKLQLTLLSAKVDTATQVTYTVKYNNKFPLNVDAYSSSAISLEGPVGLLLMAAGDVMVCKGFACLQVPHYSITLQWAIRHHMPSG